MSGMALVGLGTVLAGVLGRFLLKRNR